MPPVRPPGDPSAPALMTVTYDIAEGSLVKLLPLFEPLRHVRGRIAAMRWRLFVDSSDPSRFLETFLVRS